MEQLANLLKNFKVNIHNKALVHYREMAWLPFQKYYLQNLKKLNLNDQIWELVKLSKMKIS